MPGKHGKRSRENYKTEKKNKKATKRLRRKEFYTALKQEVRQNKVTYIVFVVLTVLVLLTLVRQFLLGNFESVMLCFLAIMLFWLPMVVQVTFRIEIPPQLEVIIMFFIFAAEILGEIESYYTKFPFWDTMLHTVNGFLCAAVGLSLVIILNKSDRIMFDLSPFFVVLVGFCFSMTIGVLWEFFEFGMDTFFRFDMQKDTIVASISSCKMDPDGNQAAYVIKNIKETVITTEDGRQYTIAGYLDTGLIDTMKDLLVNFLGAIIFSVIGFLALNGREKEKKLAMSLGFSKKTEENDFLMLAEKEDDKLLEEELKEELKEENDKQEL
ncbi:MAG: hypothetical protein K6B75_08740 [Lachnospiraceae bacterium]|nr:hypothetical protein [Lachnospiraceae bacterium]